MYNVYCLINWLLYVLTSGYINDWFHNLHHHHQFRYIIVNNNSDVVISISAVVNTHIRYSSQDKSKASC